MSAALETFLAVPPFKVTPGGIWVSDANGSIVLVCSEDTNCQRRYSVRVVDAEPHFICPTCGRLGQRMVEARPEQCGL